MLRCAGVQRPLLGKAEKAPAGTPSLSMGTKAVSGSPIARAMISSRSSGTVAQE